VELALPSGVSGQALSLVPVRLYRCKTVRMPGVSSWVLCYTYLGQGAGLWHRSWAPNGCLALQARLEATYWVGGNTQTRILVADGDTRVRFALRTLLQQEQGQILIEESADVVALAAQIRKFRPHLVFLDWELPGRPAAALLLALNGLDYHPGIVVLSTRPESEEAALAAGADAFVSKGDPPERVLASFRALLSGSVDKG
jgi:CheY-like chemotaxis protein